MVSEVPHQYLTDLVINHEDGQILLDHVRVDVTGRELVIAIMQRLGLSAKDVKGSSIDYTIVVDRTRTELGLEENVFAAGVQNGDHLTLICNYSNYAVVSREQKVVFQKISAPVHIPDDLSIQLVPVDLVDKLEEYRSDQIKWETVFWAFIGAILGIIINWVTSSDLVITEVSVVTLALLALMAVITGRAAKDYTKRVDMAKAKMLNSRTRQD
jgi:hypothetical protein